MKKTTLYMIIAMLLASFLFSPFLSGPDNLGDMPAEAIPTRAAGEDLKIENGTYTLHLTGVRYQEFNTVQILNNATLEIIGGTLKAQKLICRDSTINSTLRLVNYDETPGLISITEGVVDVHATNIEIAGSSITVQSGTSTIPNGEDGGDSQVTLVSKGSDLIINGTEINVRGHNGGLGEENLFAGKGGKAHLTLEAMNGNSVDISGSEFLVEGGTGGDAYANGIVSGAGGDSEVYVRGKSIYTTYSTFFVKGGSGGVHSPQSQGKDGGFSTIRYDAVQDISLLSTDMDSIDGLDTDLDEEEGKSRVIMVSSNGKLQWDQDKPDDLKMEILSTVNSDIFQIDASKGGAKLHQVETTKDPPLPFGSTKLEVLWWANILVKDLYGLPLEGASITWTIDPDPVPYPRDGSVILTDESGKVDIEIVARQNEDWLRYSFFAEITGGARGNSDQYRFLSNMNEDVPIIITRMILAIVEPDFSTIQGGIISITGTAQPGNPDNEVSNVTLYLDEEVIGYAIDTTDGTTPDYSTWALPNWDSEVYTPGKHTLSIVGIDDSYTVRVDKTITLNPHVVNHMPVLHSVTITDVEGLETIDPTGRLEVHVDQEDEGNSELTFKVEAYDRDVVSEFLGPGEGKKIVKAGIEVIYTKTGSTIIGRNTLVIGESSIDKYNLSGGFEFSFKIDTLLKPGTNDPFSEGEYRVVFYIEDDGGLISTLENFIFFDLKFDFYPFVDLYMEIPYMESREDRTSTHESFVVETPTDNEMEGSNTLTVVLNLTDSNDRDDILWSKDPVIDKSWTNLLFTVEIMDHENNREVVLGPDAKGASFGGSFEYTFDVGNLDNGEEGEFVITVIAKDQQGLETEYIVLARVTHNAPQPPISILDELFSTESVNVEFGSLFLLFPALLVLTILAYMGALFFINMKNNKDKASKMAILEKKKEQDDSEKGSTAIEDEVNIGVRDSQKYLEAHGASKGKDDFLKELQEAEDKSAGAGQAEPVKGETPDVKPPTPQQPPQQTPPPAPAAPVSKPVVPQQPPAAQAVKPPTPQQPPQQAPPKAPAAPAPPAVPPAAPPPPAVLKPPAQPPLPPPPSK